MHSVRFLVDAGAATRANMEGKTAAEIAVDAATRAAVLMAPLAPLAAKPAVTGAADVMISYRVTETGHVCCLDRLQYRSATVHAACAYPVLTRLRVPLVSPGWRRIRVCAAGGVGGARLQRLCG